MNQIAETQNSYFAAQPKRRGRPPSKKPAIDVASAENSAPQEVPQEAPQEPAPQEPYVDPFASTETIKQDFYGTAKPAADIGAPIINDALQSFTGIETKKRHEGLHFYVFNRDTPTVGANNELRVIGSFSSEINHDCFDVSYEKRQGQNVMLVYLTEEAQSGTSTMLPPLEEHLSVYITTEKIDFAAPKSLSYHLDRAARGHGVRPFPVVANAERDGSRSGMLDKQIGDSRPMSLGSWEPPTRSMV